MHNYYELIIKAVEGLDPTSSSESRKALYARAHDALLEKLNAVIPPFTETEITRERLALEEAVQRVEEEILQRVNDFANAPPIEVYPSFRDLAADTNDLGKSAAEAKRRYYALQADALELGRMVDAASLPNTPSMAATGSATAVLSRIWRWRGRTRR